MSWGISGDIGLEIQKLLQDQAAAKLAEQIKQAALVQQAEQLRLDREEAIARRQERADAAADRAAQRKRQEQQDKDQLALAIRERHGPGEITSDEDWAALQASPITRGGLTQRKVLEGVRPVGGTPLVASAVDQAPAFDTPPLASAGGETFRRVEPTFKEAQDETARTNKRIFLTRVGQAGSEAERRRLFAEAAGQGVDVPSELLEPTTDDKLRIQLAEEGRDNAEFERRTRLQEDLLRGRPLRTTPDFEWVLRNGRPTEIQKGTAQPGDTPMSSGATQTTEGERKNAGFMQEAEGALQTLRALDDKLTERDIFQIQSLPNEGVMGAINRTAMSTTAKRYALALAQLSEARGRSVSGAAIGKDEWAHWARTYGRQYGETKAVQADRELARQRLLDTLRAAAGRAAPPGGGSGGGGAPDLIWDGSKFVRPGGGQ